MGVIAPSMCPGHSMLCPYEETATATATATATPTATATATPAATATAIATATPTATAKNADETLALLLGHANGQEAVGEDRDGAGGADFGGQCQDADGFPRAVNVEVCRRARAALRLRNSGPILR